LRKCASGIPYFDVSDAIAEKIGRGQHFFYLNGGCFNTAEVFGGYEGIGVPQKLLKLAGGEVARLPSSKVPGEAAFGKPFMTKPKPLAVV
jgi:hypothetical protein